MLPKPPSQPPPCQYERDRLQQNLDVPPQGPVRHVQVVDPDHVLEWDAGRALDLPVPGDPGLETKPVTEPSGHLRIFVLDERPRPDEAHVPPKDIPELRQLIQRCLSQEPAGAGDPRILGDLEQPDGLILPRERLLMRVGPIDHRPELQDPELIPVTAGANLAEQHRPWGI